MVSSFNTTVFLGSSVAEAAGLKAIIKDIGLQTAAVGVGKGANVLLVLVTLDVEVVKLALIC